MENYGFFFQYGISEKPILVYFGQFCVFIVLSFVCCLYKVQIDVIIGSGILFQEQSNVFWSETVRPAQQIRISLLGLFFENVGSLICFCQCLVFCCVTMIFVFQEKIIYDQVVRGFLGHFLDHINSQSLRYAKNFYCYSCCEFVSYSMKIIYQLMGNNNCQLIYLHFFSYRDHQFFVHCSFTVL